MDSMAPGVRGLDVFHAAVEMSLVPIVLADPHQDDCPIVFANGAFCDLTGYAVAEIVGRNCRFLQGPATDGTAVARIREAISGRWNIHEEIVNYRKDGNPFWNALFVNPVFDQGGKLVYIFGTQFDVTRRRALEDGLQKSNELLSIIRSGVAAALALPMSDVQRQHLQMAQSATREAAGCHEALLQTRSGSGP